MKQYQTVIPHREDEGGVTHLLNERARARWTLERSTALTETRIVLAYAR